MRVESSRVELHDEPESSREVHDADAGDVNEMNTSRVV